MTSMLALGASGGGSTDAAGAQGTQTAPEYYLWRQYILRNGTGPRRLADYLQNAAIPALNRIGHPPVGGCEVVPGVAGPAVFLRVPLPSLASLDEIEAKMRADQDYMRAAGSYIDAT